jgi:large subunit ribosomal protein L10
VCFDNRERGTVFVSYAEAVFRVSPAGIKNLDERRETRLAISKKRKQELVDQYVDMLQQAKGIVITEYRGMTVQQLDELRGKLREHNASFTITKNTLLKIALEKVGMPVPADLLVGPVALAVALEDLPTTIKTVLEHAAAAEILVIKGSMIGGTIVQAEKLEAISKLPPLDVLRAQLVGMVTMPLTQFMGLLDEPGRQVVAVIQSATDGLVNVLAAYSQQEAA